MYYVYEIDDMEPISSGLANIEELMEFITSWQDSWDCKLVVQRTVANMIFVKEETQC